MTRACVCLDQKCNMYIKGAPSDHYNFLSNFRRFWYQMKDHIFLIIPGEFYSWKMYHLEDINENMTSYGNHK